METEDNIQMIETNRWLIDNRYDTVEHNGLTESNRGDR